MKKTITLVLMLLVSTVFSGCTLFQNLVATNSTAGGELQAVITTPGVTAVTLPGTLPMTTSLITDPSMAADTITPATTAPKTTPVTKPAVSKPAKTKPPVTKPAITRPSVTKPSVTKPPQTLPPITKPIRTLPSTKPTFSGPQATIPVFTKPAITLPPVTQPGITKPTSNLPKAIRSALNKSFNGLVVIYKPQYYRAIVATTSWDVRKYDTNTQLLLVTKKKGSLVQLYNSKLTKDQQESVMDDVIRDWTTTEDYEVIRIRYTDPETLPFNFIKVTEPGGKTTTTEIKSSMIGIDWEAIKYD